MGVPFLIIISIALFAFSKCFSQSVPAYGFGLARTEYWGSVVTVKEKKVENGNTVEKKKQQKNTRPPTIVEARRFKTSAAV